MFRSRQRLVGPTARIAGNYQTMNSITSTKRNELFDLLIDPLGLSRRGRANDNQVLRLFQS